MYKKMEGKILARRCETYCKDNEDFEYINMKIGEWCDWIPTEEDIPSLVESIKYWKSVTDDMTRNMGDAEAWSDLSCKIYVEATKKEKICVELLGRIPDMLELATEVVNKESRKLIRQKYYRMLKNKSRHAKKTDN